MFNEHMKTNFTNTSQTSPPLQSSNIYSRNEYPKIIITGKDIYDHKKEFLDIRDDHKNAHFLLGNDKRS
jgi:hypothetical protein